MIRIGLTLAAAAIAGLFPAAQAGAEPVPQQFISCERGSSNQSMTIATTREKDEACTTAARRSPAGRGMGDSLRFRAANPQAGGQARIICR